MKTLKDFDLKEKRILVRCDFNVPLSREGNILDDFRIRQTIPTIRHLVANQAKVILISHLGRPDGKVIEELRLDQVAERLSELLGQPVKKLPDCLGEEVKKAVQSMESGQVMLLENVQFYGGEKQNDSEFAKSLADYGQLFVMEAFGQAHRNYASISGIPKYLPSVAGLLMEKEIKALSGLLESPQVPLVVIIGGAKAETKAGAIDRISAKAEWILVNSLIQKELREKKIKLEYPQKVIEPLDGSEGKDIGPKTLELFGEKIASAKTIFWSGPMGKIEEERSSRGSEAVARAIIDSQAFSVVGGGETVEFINKIGLVEKFNHVSTGGGAMLAFLAGQKLPGVEALK